jgi:hypothetical protein
MGQKLFGVILLLVGVLGMVVVYSMRPPSGFGEAFMMLSRGKQNFIADPYYGILMVLCVLSGVWGVVKLIKASKKTEA